MADMISPSKPRDRRWEDLPPELLASIAECTIIPDYYRMRAVCRSWASASREVLPRALLPWIAVLSRRNQLSCKILYSIQENDNYVDFPLPLSGLSLGKSEIFSCVGTRDGWLVITTDVKVFLFNPLTGAQNPLPDFLSGIDPVIQKIVLSDSPVNATDLVAVALYRVSYCAGQHLSATNLGSNYQWTHFRYCSCTDVAFDQHGRFFAVSAAGEVYIYPELKQRSTSYISTGQNQYFSRYVNPFHDCVFGFNGYSNYFTQKRIKFQLVPTSSGDIMLILISDTRGSRPMFDVFKVVYQRQDPYLVEIKDLGDQSLFIDKRNCVSLCARDVPGLKGNCIYFLQMDCYSKFNIGKEEVTSYPKFNIGTLIQDQNLYPYWFLPSLV